MSGPVFVYLSYAATAEDRALRQRIEIHLKPLVRQDQLRIQHRDSIPIGEDPDQAIPDMIAAADIFIPLLSDRYLVDDVAHGLELSEALRHHQHSALRIWPVRAAPVAIPSGAPAKLLERLVGFPSAADATLAALRTQYQLDEQLAKLPGELAGVLRSVNADNHARRSSRGELGRRRRSSGELGPIENRFALIIGVDEFPDAPRLKYCGSDAQQLAQKMSSLRYSVRSLYDHHPDGISNRPTRQNIETALAAMCKNAGESDLLFVHIGTHGSILEKSGAILLAQDSYVDTLDRTGIAVAAMEGLLLASRARRIVLSLDACHSGFDRLHGKRSLGTPSPSVADFYSKVYDAAEGYAVIAACTAEQLAYEDLMGGYGAYSRFLLEALDGTVALPGCAPARAKGFVTLDDVRKHVLVKMREWCFLQNKQPQEPNVRSQLIGDLILADYRSDAAPAATQVAG